MAPRKHNPEEAERACLRCKRIFVSEWVGNRICRRCKENEQPAEVPRAFTTGDES